MYNDLLIKHNESKFRLRTPLLHELHLQAIEQNHSLIRAYGVVSKCSLSDLVRFSPVTAFLPDIMHDCLEGVIPVFLHYLFNDLAQNNICTFTIVNEIFKKFHFGVCEVCNKPRCLPGNVVSVSGHISATGSEAWCIFRLPPFVIGDLVPVRHDSWKLYLLLSEIMDKVIAPQLEISAINYLKLLISDFYVSFAERAPHLVKPKLLFLLHYSSMIKNFGPLRHHWCMRFESFHRKVKKIVKYIPCFKNVCFTVAKRLQRNKCYEMSETNCLTEVDNFGAVTALDEIHPAVVSFILGHLGSCDGENNLSSVNFATVKGVCYRPRTVLILDMENDVPVFGLIEQALLYNFKVIVVCRYVKPLQFIVHLHAYSVKITGKHLFVEPGFELCPHPIDLYETFFGKCIRLRYSIYKLYNSQ